MVVSFQMVGLRVSYCLWDSFLHYFSGITSIRLCIEVLSFSFSSCTASLHSFSASFPTNSFLLFCFSPLPSPPQIVMLRLCCYDCSYSYMLKCFIGIIQLKNDKTCACMKFCGARCWSFNTVELHLRWCQGNCKVQT